MPIKYCRSCGAKNEYSYSAPEKCKSCQGSFTRSKPIAARKVQPAPKREMSISEIQREVEKEENPMSFRIVDAGGRETLKFEDIVGSNLKKK